jgi:GWxTD domain-containing protein
VKSFLLIFLLFCFSVYGQPKQNRPHFPQNIPFESEIVQFPRTDGDFTVYYTYRMPYRLLIFERKDDSYSAEFRVIVEIKDDDGNIITRDIKDSKVSVKDFSLTNDHSLFINEFLRFKLKPADYKLSAIISDLNSTDELPIKPVELNLEEEKESIVLHPLVIQSQEMTCENNKAFVLANSGGKIPFSSVNYNLIIPVSDTLVNELEIKIENNDEEIYNGRISESYLIPIGIEMCENKIALTIDSTNTMLKNFVLRNVNQKLVEGDVVLKVINNDKDIDRKFESKVIWFNKPFSLRDPEKAIEYLSFIVSDSIVSAMLDEPEDDYPKVLYEYWKKFDPTPQTSYNEVMFEYYSRIDYAMREFRSIGNENGLKTDRGMIYIKFGKPEKIERVSNPEGQIVEVWTYLNPERKFSFVDKKGTGNFTLIQQ